jgi:copper chaperone CopZ
MKTIQSFLYSGVLMLLFITGASLSVSAQTDQVKSDQTIAFKVYGVCGECKERIEAAALDTKGVKKAEWDIQTDTLVLIGSSKMDKMKVAKNISKAGYKSEFMPADKKGYDKLPGCCQYVEGADKH